MDTVYKRIAMIDGALTALGGRRFIVMTGAGQFMADDTSLTFHVPRAKDGINVVRITPDDTDEYTLMFFRVRGTVVTEVSKVEHVGVENVQAAFSRATGLEVPLWNP